MARPKTKQVEAMDAFMRQFYQWHYRDRYSLRDVTILFSWLFKMLIMLGHYPAGYHITESQWRRRDREWQTKWQVSTRNVDPLPGRPGLANHELWFVEDRLQNLALYEVMANLERPNPFPVPKRKACNMRRAATSASVRNHTKHLLTWYLSSTKEPYKVSNLDQSTVESADYDMISRYEADHKNRRQDDAAGYPSYGEYDAAWVHDSSRDSSAQVDYQQTLNYSEYPTIPSASANLEPGCHNNDRLHLDAWTPTKIEHAHPNLQDPSQAVCILPSVMPQHKCPYFNPPQHGFCFELAGSEIGCRAIPSTGNLNFSDDIRGRQHMSASPIAYPFLHGWPHDNNAPSLEPDCRIQTDGDLPVRSESNLSYEDFPATYNAILDSANSLTGIFAPI